MRKDRFFSALVHLFAILAIVIMFAIILSVFSEGLPLLNRIPLWAILTGTEWYPTFDPPSFGILPLICASLLVTLISALFSVPLGIGSAIFLAEVAPETLRNILKPILELLVAIPSVVYGLFGMTVLSEFIMKIFKVPIGLNAFTAGILLGIMATPTIASVAEDAIFSVPVSIKEASLGIGATRFETLYHIILPAAKSGIVTAIILGLSRAIGETMTVVMVAGGSPIIPHSIFDPVRPMTATIAAEMGEAAHGSLHYHALFFIGAILMTFTYVFNILGEWIRKRGIYRQ